MTCTHTRQQRKRAYFCLPGVPTWRLPTCLRARSGHIRTTGRCLSGSLPPRRCRPRRTASAASILRRSSPPSLSAPHRRPRRRATGRSSNFKWLEDQGEVSSSTMAKTCPPKIPEKAAPVLHDDEVRRLLADRSGKDFHKRRDLAIIRLFLDTGMRLEGIAGLHYSADDPELSDVDLRSRVVRITAKGLRELVLPIGAKAARDIDRYIRIRAARSTCGRFVAAARQEGAPHAERRLPDDQGPGLPRSGSRSSPAPATAYVLARLATGVELSGF